MIRISKGMAVFMAALALTGCATAEGGMPRSALDRSINECVAAVALGAILGAVADKNRGQGALIGAGIGGVACGVLIAINNERDKQRVREAQLAALNAGSSQRSDFVGDDGRTRTVQTTVRDAPTPTAIAANRPPTMLASLGDAGDAMMMAPMTSPDAFVGPCRTAQSQIAVQGQSADIPSELFCRTAAGDWKPYNG